MILNSQSASGAPVGDHVPGLVAVPMGFGGLRDGRLFPLVEDSEHLCLLSAPNRAMSVMKRLVRLRIRSRTSRRTFTLESPGLSRSISRHIVFQLEARRWLTSLGMSRRMVSTLLQSLYHRRRRWCRRSFGGRSEDREQFGLGRCRKLCLQTTDAHSLGGRAKRRYLAARPSEEVGSRPDSTRAIGVMGPAVLDPPGWLEPLSLKSSMGSF